MKANFYFFVISILLISCTSKTDIGSIKRNPRQYVNKNVNVEGTVSKTFSLVFINYFELEDETGAITVITDKPLPNENQKMTVEGKVQYYSLGNMRLLVIKENGSD